MASGNPSIVRQIAVTSSTCAARSNDRSTARAAWAKSRTASDEPSDRTSVPSGSTSNTTSPDTRRRARLVASTRRSGQRRVSSTTIGAALDDVLEVVEHDQHAASAESVFEGRHRIDIDADADAQVADDELRYQSRLSDAGEIDEARLGRVLAGSGRHLRGEPGLAHATGPEQRDDR